MYINITHKQKEFEMKTIFFKVCTRHLYYIQFFHNVIHHSNILNISIIKNGISFLIVQFLQSSAKNSA